MPVKEFICSSCGHIFERLTKTDENTQSCPKCGQTSNIRYSGSCNLISKGGGGCSGNCKTCGGCKH